MSDTVNVTLDSSVAENDPATWTIGKKGSKWLATDSTGRDRTASDSKKGLMKDIASYQVAFDQDAARRSVENIPAVTADEIADAMLTGNEALVNELVEAVPTAEREAVIADASKMVVAATLVDLTADAAQPPIVISLDDDSDLNLDTLPESTPSASTPEHAPEVPPTETTTGETDVPVVLTKEQQMAALKEMEEEEAAEKAAKKPAASNGNGTSTTATTSAISVTERVATFIRRITKDYDGKTLDETRVILTPLAARVKPEGSGEREVWRHQARFLHITRGLDGSMKMADIRQPAKLVELVAASDLKLTAHGTNPSGTTQASAVASARTKSTIVQFPVAKPSITIPEALGILADLDPTLTVDEARCLLGERLAALSADYPFETLVYTSDLIAAAAEQAAAEQAAAEQARHEQAAAAAAAAADEAALLDALCGS